MSDTTASGSSQPSPTQAAELRHNLRNSLGQIIGYSEILIEDAMERGYEDMLPDLERITSAGRRMLALMDAARAGHYSPEAVSTDSDTPESIPSAPLASSFLDESHLRASSFRMPLSSEIATTTEEAPGRVLIVDDDATNRYLLERRLTMEGYETMAADGGETALRLIEEQAFDIVLLDLMMPGIGGFETLRRIKADPVLHHLPVLMISAHEDTGTVVHCIEAGASDYLTKPFDPVLLRARVGACLRAKRLRDREELLLSEVQASLQRERRIADALQRSLVRPIEPNAFGGMSIASLYEAAWTEAQVGGDLFDAFRLPGNRIALIVADASGKGLDAATRVAQVKYALRAYAREANGNAAAIAEHLNDFLCDEDVNTEASFTGSFVTLALALMDSGTGQTTLISAGCEPPLILRTATSTIETVDISGPPLGIISGVEYQGISCTLEQGDILILYTDGITEARCGSDLLGGDGLKEIILTARDHWKAPDLNLLATALLEGARAFGNGTLRDDACLLLIRREPPA